MESILTTIKKMLGLEESYEVFDDEIIVHINSAFMMLNQLGVGPKDPFYISDKTAKWSDFTKNFTNIESVKSFIYIQVRILFDPPTSSFVLDALTRQAAEYAWRLNIQPNGGDDNG